MRLRPLAFVLPLALGAALCPATSFALRGPDALAGHPTYERFDTGPGADATVRGQVTWDRPSRRLASAYALFKSEVGSGWRASFDARTGVPSRMYGPGIEVAGSMVDGSVAEAFCRSLLARHAGLLAPGSQPGDFELVANDLDAGIRTLGFVQRTFVQGAGALKVQGGQLSFRFKNDRMYLIGSEALPDVGAPGSGGSLAAPATIDSDRAEKAALTWVERDLGPATAGAAGAPLVLPSLDGKGRLRYAVVVPVEVTALDVTSKHRVYVDASSYAPVAREQLLRFASGSVLLNVPERAPAYGPRYDSPASLATINVEGSAQQTDELGAIAWTGSEPTPIQLFLNGPRVRVLSDSGPEAMLEVSLADATPYVWNQSADIEVDAQLNVFVHASKVREYARTYAPQLGFLNQQVKATVNIDDICNAYSDGTSINFYRAGQGCENTGRLADVVYHEYGHSIHFHAIIEGVGAFDGALSEGISDYNAATITGDPATARGFFSSEEELRHIDPEGEENRYPEDLVGEVHHDGLIIGQALWDMRKNLIASLGQAEGVQRANELFYQGIRRSVDMPTMYIEVLAADDDDGDLSNGTPNVCEINEAFDRHGLRSLGKQSSLSVVPLGEDGYRVQLELTGLFAQCSGDAVSGGTLSWRDRAEPSDSGSVALEREGNILSATIPAQPGGTVIKYQVEVELDGPSLVLPDNPADPEYELFMGELKPLYCTDFETDPEEQGWTHGLEDGTPDEGADDWSWGEANGNAANGDPLEAFSGDKVFGNDLALGGQYNGLYQAEKINFAKSPVIDVSGHDNVHLQYRRWLNVEDGHYDRATILGNDQVVWENFDSSDGKNSVTHHRDREWRFHDVDLSGVISADQTVQITYKLESDAGLEFGGWTMDDFCIVALDSQGPGPCQGDECGEGGAAEGGAGGGGGGDPADDLASDGGCDCAVAASPQGSSSAFAWAGIALAAAAFLRTRRARQVPAVSR